MFTCLVYFRSPLLDSIVVIETGAVFWKLSLVPSDLDTSQMFYRTVYRTEPHVQSSKQPLEVVADGPMNTTWVQAHQHDSTAGHMFAWLNACRSNVCVRKWWHDYGVWKQNHVLVYTAICKYNPPGVQIQIQLVHLKVSPHVLSLCNLSGSSSILSIRLFISSSAHLILTRPYLYITALTFLLDVAPFVNCSPFSFSFFMGTVDWLQLISQIAGLLCVHVHVHTSYQ